MQIERAPNCRVFGQRDGAGKREGRASSEVVLEGASGRIVRERASELDAARARDHCGIATEPDGVEQGIRAGQSEVRTQFAAAEGQRAARRADCAGSGGDGRIIENELPLPERDAAREGAGAAQGERGVVGDADVEARGRKRAVGDGAGDERGTGAAEDERASPSRGLLIHNLADREYRPVVHRIAKVRGVGIRGAVIR